MSNRIELLDTKLLKLPAFKTFNRWKKILASEPGWHYSLDIVWVLKEIEMLNLPEKATIVDAGGGYGLIQFILASKGYNVISVDLANRKSILPIGMLFNIKNLKSKRDIGNKYTRHIRFEKKPLHSFLKAYILVKRLMNWSISLYIAELFGKRVKRGTITFYQSDFSSMDKLDSKSVDAVISVSAIEHVANRKKLPACINEFERILKPKSPMIITTSATNRDTWFHEPSQGWCFSKIDLSKLMGFKTKTKNYIGYKQTFNNIKRSKYLRSNLPTYYRYTTDCGMPLGVWNPQYIPVGIKNLK